MDRHKSLYKDNSSLFSPKNQRLNRERLAIRAKQRSDKFASIRKISVSPTPHVKMEPVVETEFDENNEKSNCVDSVEPELPAPLGLAKLSRVPVSRIALAACKTDQDKLTRQEKFLLRYIEWKDAKKQEILIKKQMHLQKKPFVPAVRALNDATFTKNYATKTSSIVPTSYKFKAPEGLNNPLQETKLSNNNTQRKSLYNVIPTPEKRKNDIKKLPIPRKALPINHSKRPAHTFLQKTTKSEPKVATPTFYTQSKKTPFVQQNSYETTVKKIADVQEPVLKSKTASTKIAAPSAGTSTKPLRLIKPRPFVLPPPPPPPKDTGAIPKRKQPYPRIAKLIKESEVEGLEKVKSRGAVGKAKATAIVNDAPKNKKRSTEAIKKPKLAVSMKAKKIPATKNAILSKAAKNQPAKFKLNKNTLLAAAAQQNLPIAETPTDSLSNINPFGMFVTSTKRKSISNSQGTLEFLTLDTNLCDTISPVEPLALAKPQLAEGDTAAKCSNKSEKNNRKSKFNFVRYSEAAIETSVQGETSPLHEGQHQQEIESKKTQPLSDQKQEYGMVDKALAQPQLAEGDTSAKCSNKSKKNNRKNKFNFVRYSEAATETSVQGETSPLHDGQNQQDIDSKKTQPLCDQKQENGILVAALAEPHLAEVDTAAKCSNKSEKNNRKNKFNFVRYSETATETSVQGKTSPLHEGQHQQESESKKTQLLCDQKQENGMVDADKTISNNETLTNITPTRTPTNDANEERPINYLSPFVSVTRGKVNSKIEKEKRNSIYLQGIQNAETEALAKLETKKQEVLVETRRTMETVRYFRKQLSVETERLHDICDKWESYKTENLVHLQETGGDDMINVTIGQTKLLTSKKFNQFSGLIDRCERAVTAPESVVNDGSEDTKPITTVDLEGFWCMVGLQVDNVEKRFHNLERWRDNDWHDPEDVKPKVKLQKQPAKVKKVKTTKAQATKAKPSSGLQQMMRKMHADMRKNKAAAAAESTNNADIILTPSRKRLSSNVAKTVIPQRDSTPTRRISILVKDRKLHSASPTILTINTTPNRRASYIRHRTDSPICKESPKMLNHLQEFRRSMLSFRKSCGERNELWKAAINGADQQRRSSLLGTPAPSTPPPSKGRKSILKTPGTAKGKPKSVIFNEELRIKKYKFTIDSDHSDAENDSKLENGEEARKMNVATEEDNRTYSLRNRKIVLRPSSEFVIPT